MPIAAADLSRTAPSKQMRHPRGDSNGMVPESFPRAVTWPRCPAGRGALLMLLGRHALSPGLTVLLAGRALLMQPWRPALSLNRLALLAGASWPSSWGAQLRQQGLPGWVGTPCPVTRPPCLAGCGVLPI